MTNKTFDWPSSELPTCDISRIKLINQLNQEQKQMFALGLGYQQAWLTDAEVRLGKSNIPLSDIRTMDVIKAILVDFNFDTDITPIKKDKET